MGCDIHAYIEVRTHDTWKILETPRPYKCACGCDYTPRTPQLPPAFDVRHYGLFSILAGVRNYDEIEPVAPPRGVPDVASQEYQDIVSAWDGDWHTASWLTAAEILADTRLQDPRLPGDWQEFVTRLRDLVRLFGDTDVRLVFFFDN